MKIKPAPSGARRATRAQYDDRSDRFVIDLDNEVTVSLPRIAIAPFENADRYLLSRIVLHNGGTEIEWPELDFSFSVPEMLPELIGLGATVAQNARRAGSTTSEKKAAAVRVNGAKGGRPRGTWYAPLSQIESVTGAAAEISHRESTLKHAESGKRAYIETRSYPCGCSVEILPGATPELKICAVHRPVAIERQWGHTPDAVAS